MPRGGPGSVSTVRLPAGWPRTAQALCWSYDGGRWWVVDHGESYDAMVASAAARQSATDHGTRGDARKGTKPQPAIPGCRFVATDRNGNPQLVWDTLRDSE